MFLIFASFFSNFSSWFSAEFLMISSLQHFGAFWADLPGPKNRFLHYFVPTCNVGPSSRPVNKNSTKLGSDVVICDIFRTTQRKMPRYLLSFPVQKRGFLTTFLKGISCHQILPLPRRVTSSGHQILPYCPCHEETSQDHMQRSLEGAEQPWRCKTQWDYEDQTWQQQPWNVQSRAWPIRPWSDHGPVSPQPARSPRSPFAFPARILYKTPGHFAYGLPFRKVTLQDHQILPLPRRITSFPYLIPPLLACSFTELFLCWTLTWLNYSFAELLLDWTVPLLNGSFTELFFYCTVPLVNCSLTEPFLYWFVPWLNRSFIDLFLDWTVPWLICSLLNCFLPSHSLMNCSFTELCFSWKVRASEVSQLNFLWYCIHLSNYLLRYIIKYICIYVWASMLK